jgi:hypothetical protein
LAAALAFLVGAGLIGGVGWMVWYGHRQGMLFGYIFFGLLPFILGLWLVLGARRLWRGNPSGAALARTALWVPLTLFVGAIASTPLGQQHHRTSTVDASVSRWHSSRRARSDPTCFEDRLG